MICPKRHTSKKNGRTGRSVAGMIERGERKRTADDVPKASKYPPAEPGALVLEPLEAAYPCRTSQASLPLLESPRLVNCETAAAWATYSFLLCPHLVWLNLSRPSITELPLHELGGSRFGISLMERRCRPPDMSNFCCLPGRAGGTPMLVSRRRFMAICPIPVIGSSIEEYPTTISQYAARLRQINCAATGLSRTWRIWRRNFRISKNRKRLCIALSLNLIPGTTVAHRFRVFVLSRG